MSSSNAESAGAAPAETDNWVLFLWQSNVSPPTLNRTLHARQRAVPQPLRSAPAAAARPRRQLPPSPDGGSVVKKQLAPS